MENKMYQVSTIQALLLGYLKNVITARDLATHGEIGLGTFENVNGEMIVLDNKVYKANNKGDINEVDPDVGVPFASVAHMDHSTLFELKNCQSMDEVKENLNIAIEEDFGINSMYVVRLDGHFDFVKARSETGKKAQHMQLSEILEDNQEDFVFEDIDGTMVCLYFPDYMCGINAAGWHLHFISKDHKHGGHVFDLSFKEIQAKRCKINNIEFQIPTDAAFDTYSLKQVSHEDVAKVEQ